MKKRKRPGFDEYFMRLAIAVRFRSNCVGRHVGAILVKDRRILATGYNGTPAGLKNCEEGGCYRCANRGRYAAGQGYDVCICVHAEQNTLLSAARFGMPVEGAVLYSTHQPCFGCAKELLQAKVAAVHFIHPWEPPPALKAQYRTILSGFPGGARRLRLADPEAA